MTHFSIKIADWLAVMLRISMGINATMFVAGLYYAALAPISFSLMRLRRERTAS